ncbi:aldose 1-epimerase [Citrobacter koseri]|uniref:aldose 1-epimerase n=1 Tax=Citrobacter koseri TaxID=545 RepID=UPI000A43C2F4|nr:aldose 1-epimerase [Citrobacter koseri]MDT7484572.1 aldose 1-epimerase [Citrobacter koseri]MDT7493929.1 aldose 1-epimerase [Citrobacter koseri]MDU4399686.1 aldose 1-epimerase [Citrobacter koseri]CAG0233068.1 Aldose 1-epimerase [Citrobacter koseri]CAH5993505.1 Aldose 1-epimerase [Citrobacter koseri]
MDDTLTLQNTHLRMRVDPQGGRLLSLFSLAHQQAVLREGCGVKPGECGLFPMLPVANRVAENRFLFRGEVVNLPRHEEDAVFFLHGDGWLRRWDTIAVHEDACHLRSGRQMACGYDYVADLHYQLDASVLHASLTITHRGERPMLYGCGFHPYFAFDRHSTVQFAASGYWPEGKQHLPQEWQSDIPRQADFSGAQYGEDAWLNVGYSGWSGRAIVQRDVMKVTLLSQTPWLMLFRMQGESFLCLEPQSHPVNAHNMPGQPGLQALAQGDQCHFAMQIAVV